MYFPQKTVKFVKQRANKVRTKSACSSEKKSYGSTNQYKQQKVLQSILHEGGSNNNDHEHEQLQKEIFMKGIDDPNVIKGRSSFRINESSRIVIENRKQKRQTQQINMINSPPFTPPSQAHKSKKEKSFTNSIFNDSMLVAVLQNKSKENKNSKFDPNSNNTNYPSQNKTFQIEVRDAKNESNNHTQTWLSLLFQSKYTAVKIQNQQKHNNSDYESVLAEGADTFLQVRAQGAFDYSRKLIYVDRQKNIYQKKIWMTVGRFSNRVPFQIPINQNIYFIRKQSKFFIMLVFQWMIFGKVLSKIFRQKNRDINYILKNKQQDTHKSLNSLIIKNVNTQDKQKQEVLTIQKQSSIRHLHPKCLNQHKINYEVDSKEIASDSKNTQISRGLPNDKKIHVNNTIYDNSYKLTHREQTVKIIMENMNQEQFRSKRSLRQNYRIFEENLGEQLDKTLNQQGEGLELTMNKLNQKTERTESNQLNSQSQQNSLCQSDIEQIFKAAHNINYQQIQMEIAEIESQIRLIADNFQEDKVEKSSVSISQEEKEQSSVSISQEEKEQSSMRQIANTFAEENIQESSISQFQNIFAEGKVKESSNINFSDKTETQYHQEDGNCMELVNTFTQEKTESGYDNNHFICIDKQQILSESQIDQQILGLDYVDIMFNNLQMFNQKSYIQSNLQPDDKDDDLQQQQSLDFIDVLMFEQSSSSSSQNISKNQSFNKQKDIIQEEKIIENQSKNYVQNLFSFKINTIKKPQNVEDQIQSTIDKQSKNYVQNLFSFKINTIKKPQNFEDQIQSTIDEQSKNYVNNLFNSSINPIIKKQEQIQNIQTENDEQIIKTQSNQYIENLFQTKIIKKPIQNIQQTVINQSEDQTPIKDKSICHLSSDDSVYENDSMNYINILFQKQVISETQLIPEPLIETTIQKDKSLIQTQSKNYINDLFHQKINPQLQSIQKTKQNDKIKDENNMRNQKREILTIQMTIGGDIKKANYQIQNVVEININQDPKLTQEAQTSYSIDPPNKLQFYKPFETQIIPQKTIFDIKETQTSQRGEKKILQSSFVFELHLSPNNGERKQLNKVVNTPENGKRSILIQERINQDIIQFLPEIKQEVQQVNNLKRLTTRQSGQNSDFLVSRSTYKKSKNLSNEEYQIRPEGLETERVHNERKDRQNQSSNKSKDNYFVYMDGPIIPGSFKKKSEIQKSSPSGSTPKVQPSQKSIRQNISPTPSAIIPGNINDQTIQSSKLATKPREQKNVDLINNDPVKSKDKFINEGTQTQLKIKNVDYQTEFSSSKYTSYNRRHSATQTGLEFSENVKNDKLIHLMHKTQTQEQTTFQQSSKPPRPTTATQQTQSSFNESNSQQRFMRSNQKTYDYMRQSQNQLKTDLQPVEEYFMISKSQFRRSPTLYTQSSLPGFASQGLFGARTGSQTILHQDYISVEKDSQLRKNIHTETSSSPFLIYGELQVDQDQNRYYSQSGSRQSQYFVQNYPFHEMGRVYGTKYNHERFWSLGESRKSFEEKTTNKTKWKKFIKIKDVKLVQSRVANLKIKALIKQNQMQSVGPYDIKQETPRVKLKKFKIQWK